MIAALRTGWRDLPGRAAWIAFTALLVLRFHGNVKDLIESGIRIDDQLRASAPG